MSDSGPLVGRSHIFEAAVRTLRNGPSKGVLLTGGPGSGKTVLSRLIAQALVQEMATVHLQATPTLAQIRFGALAPHLADTDVSESDSPNSVLRVIWPQLERLRQIESAPLLLIIDDAENLDDASAAVISELVMVHWVKLLATSNLRPGLPGTLGRLWYDGLVESLHLPPLNRQQMKRMCAAILGPTVPACTSDVVYRLCGGEPMLARVLVEESLRMSRLKRKHGLWLFSGAPPIGADLRQTLGRRLLRSSAGERQALQLVALAEPLETDVLSRISGSETVDALIDKQLVHFVDGLRPVLRIEPPIYAEVIRSLMSIPENLVLHERVQNLIPMDPADPEAFLNRVGWALGWGGDVPDELLVRAATLAAQLFENTLAHRAASLVSDPAYALAAHRAGARAHFNEGTYTAAADLLDPDLATGSTASDLLSGSLLWTATAVALGRPNDDIISGARQLNAAGAALASTDGGEATIIAAQIGHRAALMELLSVSTAGDFSDLDRRLCLIEQSPTRGEWSAQDLGLTLAVRARWLNCTGKPVSAEQKFAAALTLSQDKSRPGSPDGLFYTTDFISMQGVLNLIDGGHWASAEAVLDQVWLDPRPGFPAFSGGFHAAGAFILVRQQRYAKALEAVIPGLESLRHNDPHRLFRLAVALAFYACAAIGEIDRAMVFLNDFQQAVGGSIEPTRGYAEALVAAGKELCLKDGAGLAELRELGLHAAAAGMPLVELQAHFLSLALGDNSRTSRMVDVAQACEGEWAAGLQAYGQAVDDGGAAAYVRAAEALRSRQMTVLAAHCFRTAAELYRQEANVKAVQWAMAGLTACLRDLDAAEIPTPDAGRAAELLTRRELLIVSLAVQGLTDRQIAEQLHTSVRTVEGHLYRSYGKLEVAGRQELAELVGMFPREHNS